MCWKRYCKNSYPLEGEEIIAYNSDWIDKYYNPLGIRIGYKNGDDFITAFWDHKINKYITINNELCRSNLKLFERFENISNIPDYWLKLPKFKL